MPRHDFTPRPPRRDRGGASFTPGFGELGWALKLRFYGRGKRKPGRDPEEEEGGVPADPRRPSGLSGGAAAALEFPEE